MAGKDYIDLNNVFRLMQASEGGTFRFGDLLVEVNTSAFTGAATDAASVAVPTQLNQIVAGFAVPFDSYSPATDADKGKQYQLFVRPDVAEDTDSHLKTFSVFRSSLTPISGLKFAYILFGRHFATD